MKTKNQIIKILKYRKNIINFEEIATWLLENVNKCETCEFYNISCNKKYCLQGHLNWLVKAADWTTLKYKLIGYDENNNIIKA